MDNWELDKQIEDILLPSFQPDLDKEVFLLKFQALIAGKIFQTALEKGVDSKILFDGIGNYLDSLNEKNCSLKNLNDYESEL